MLSSKLLELVRNDLTKLTDDEILANALYYAADFVQDLLGETSSGLAEQIILLMVEFNLYHRYGYIDDASKVMEQVNKLLDYAGGVHIESDAITFDDDELEKW